MDIQAGMTMGLLAPLVADIPTEGLSLVGEATAEELELTAADATLRIELATRLVVRSSTAPPAPSPR